MTKREIPSVTKGWLSTLCCWVAAVHTPYPSLILEKMDVKLMMMIRME